MRRAFADTLIELATDDPTIILLTGDLGFGVFDSYQEQFPDRFINVGICEQAMVDIAVGLSFEGFKPIVYSIASFMTGRAWEQIKIANYQGASIVVVGAGGAYTYSTAGTTHHAAEDLGLMSLIPGMTVTAPGCPNEIRQLLPQLIEQGGMSYMRIGKYGESDYDCRVEVGKALPLRYGKDLVIATTGDMAATCIEVGNILEHQGLDITIYQYHTVKPLDTKPLLDLEERYDTLLVVEEHSPIGGLADAISNTGICCHIDRCGPSDSLLLDSMHRPEFLKSVGLDVDSIVEKCMRLI